MDGARLDPVTVLAAAGVAAAGPAMLGSPGLLAIPLAMTWVGAHVIAAGCPERFTGAGLGLLIGLGFAGFVVFATVGFGAVFMLPALGMCGMAWLAGLVDLHGRARTHLARGMVFGAGAGAVAAYAVLLVGTIALRIIGG